MVLDWRFESRFCSKRALTSPPSRLSDHGQITAQLDKFSACRLSGLPRGFNYVSIGAKSMARLKFRKNASDRTIVDVCESPRDWQMSNHKDHYRRSNV